jgi:hypothetical protein
MSWSQLEPGNITTPNFIGIFSDLREETKITNWQATAKEGEK